MPPSLMVGGEAFTLTAGTGGSVWPNEGGANLAVPPSEKVRVRPCPELTSNCQSCLPSNPRHLLTFRELHQNSPRAVLLSGDDEFRVLSHGVIAAPWWADF